MAILNWEQYSSLHTAISQENFEKAEKKAEMDLRGVIGPIRYLDLCARDISEDFYIDQLRECIARIIDYNVEIQPKTGTGVASVSNDGYSESYSTELQTVSAALEEKNRNIRAWLSGTGLVGAY